MIVGDEISSAGLLRGGSKENLKHSTFDLTVGEIIPIGKTAIKARRRDNRMLIILSQEKFVWILSKEEFAMPANVTGLATLRTSLTKAGILALNVGIIDSLFDGPLAI